MLSFTNHLLTEFSLYRSIASHDEPGRKQVAMGAMTRLVAISVVALLLVVLFWPYGIATLFGLALMHVVLLVFTGLPLVVEMRREMRNEVRKV